MECSKCEAAFPKKKAAETDDVAKGKKGKDNEGGDDEDEDTDGGDDNNEDDEGGDDNPKKPAKEKKTKAATIDVDTLANALGAAMENSPLAKAVKDLQEGFAAISKNPPKPGKAVVKSADNEPENPAVKKAEDEKNKAMSPADVLKSQLSKPNFFRNTPVQE